MLEPFVRVSAFLAKELNEVRHQPRLLASMILGPFLVLMLFGAGFQSGRPQTETALVLPQGAPPPDLIEQVRAVISANTTIVAETADRQQALQLLRENQVDVVKVLPSAALLQPETGEQATIEVMSNSISPQVEEWIAYVALAETNELNKAVLREVVEQTQAEARQRRDEVARLRADLAAVDQGLSAARRAELAEQVEQARRSLALLSLVAPLLERGPSPAPSRAELDELDAVLDRVGRLLATDELGASREELQATIRQLDELEAMLDAYVAVPSLLIVSPLRSEYQNIRGRSYDMVQYFLPAVLALLIQHIGVALGALTIVRERLSGAFEIFRVAPVSMAEVLLGKYSAYLLVIGVVVVALGTLLPLLNMPIVGRWQDIALLVLLLALASLGFGFLISVLASTESQAVQYALLFLLLSIFFGNFFLPLENFWRPVQVVGYLLPLTHGVTGLQATLLANRAPEPATLWALAALAAATFLATLLILRAQARLT